MVTREQVFTYARSLEGATLDSPFTEDFDTVVLRHADSRRWFGLCFFVRADKVGLEGTAQTDILNLKCEPNLAVLLREKHKWLIPAYHMNKAHWNTIILSEVDDMHEFCRLIDHSYSLTRGTRK